jgi:hypothetical protein
MAVSRADLAHEKRTQRITKVVVGLGALGLLAYLFSRSVTSSRTQPYVIAAETMRPWTLALEPGDAPNLPVLVLRPPGGLAGQLSNQLFKRTMESMGPPATTGIPLVLRRELDGAPPGTPPFPGEALLAAAREAGLDAAPLQPKCLGHRRADTRDGRQQMYFVLFDVPAFARFRQQIGTLLAAHGVPADRFEPDLVSPALMLALIESSTGQWLPLQANAKTDCVAPIAIGAPL